MRRVLIIANLFHASPRIPGLAKYLPEFGWEPIIITGSLPEDTFGIEFKFLKTPFPNVFESWKRKLHMNTTSGFQTQIGVPLSLRENNNSITNTFSNLIKKIIAYPDEHKEWKKYAIEAAKNFLKKEKVDAIMSSSSPFTSHLIAQQIKVDHGISWVADLRDLWSQNHNYHYGMLSRNFDRLFELKALKKSDAIITVSPLWADELAKLHGRDHVYTITNGFDPDQMSNEKIKLTDKFTITYTGIIYEGKQNVEIFFSAVKDMISDRTIDPEKICIKFYGPQSEKVNNVIKKFDMSNIATQYGKIDRKISFEKQRESQLLLIFYWNDPLVKGWYPLKSFEYLAARRPILVVGGSDDDVLGRLLYETNSGKCCNTAEDVKNVLREAYLEYRKSSRLSYKGYVDKIRKYSYREMANRFARVLDNIITY